MLVIYKSSQATGFLLLTKNRPMLYNSSPRQMGEGFEQGIITLTNNPPPQKKATADPVRRLLDKRGKE